MRTPGPRGLLACLALASLLVSGCGSPAGTTQKVLTGPGVTDTTITLGVLTDQSGPYGPLGTNVVQGNQLYVDQVNAAGGVCGRHLALEIRDTAFDLQRATNAYFELEPQVLGFLQMTGADITEKIVPDLLESKALVVPTSWSATLLGNPYMMVVGATYDVDILNGLAHLSQHGMLHGGDTIGMVYQNNDYGQTSLAGAQFGAQKLDANLEALPAELTAPDVAAQIAQLKAKHATAVVLALTPKQTATAFAAAAQLGFTAPMLMLNPGFDPAALTPALAPVYAKQGLLLSSVAPFGADLPGAREVATAYQAKYPDQRPTLAVNYGYAAAISFVEVLRKACGENDLSRSGVQHAFREMTGVDTRGLTAPLRFTAANHAATTQDFVLRPNAGTTGGLDVVSGLAESDLARARTS